VPCDERNAGNVVDRFLRIKLGALTADLVENIDKVRFHIEQAKFEHGEQSARTRANNQHIGFDRFAHVGLIAPLMSASFSVEIAAGQDNIKAAPRQRQAAACLANGAV
jgi:hypothetical protein